jgi:hypothetical protein
MAMTEVPVTGFKGFVFDYPSKMLGLETWSVLLNCRIEDGSIVPAQPYGAVFDVPTDPPYALFDYTDNASAHSWYYAAATKIYNTSGTSSTDVSRTVGGAYATIDSIGWDGGVYNQVPCFTNGIDVLQIKESADTNFKDDPNFPATYFAERIRGYKNRLVAFKLTIDGDAAGSTVLLSDIADPGFGPASWDAADPTTQANEIDLTETPGDCVDGRPLGGSFIIYKTDSAWRITYVGGTLVDSVERVPGAIGALSNNCVQQIGNTHLVVGAGDIYTYDGANVNSILMGNQKVFFASIDPLYIDRVFTIKQEEKSLIWICYPVPGSDGACTNALLYNYKTNDLGHTQLPNIRAASVGQVEEDGSVTFDAAGWGDGLFNDDTGTFNDGGTNPSKPDIILVSQVNELFYHVGESAGFNGVDAQWSAYKLDLNLPGDQTSQHVSRIIPQVSGPGTLLFQIGAKDSISDSYVWSNIQTFIGATSQYKVDIRASGRYLSLGVGGNIMDYDTKFYGYILTGGVSGRR